MSKRLLIAMPHGFCTGVRKAVDAALDLAESCDPPIYCLNEIVHNQQVVSDLALRGFTFVRSLDEVPRGSTVLFSAHGIPPSVRKQAEERDLKTVDATCPFVDKVHEEVKQFAARGYTVFLIGHRSHEEVIGVSGEAPDHVIVVESEKEAMEVNPTNPEKVAVVTQTTLCQDDTNAVTEVLRSRFPDLEKPRKSDICYATRQRQQAVREVARQADLVIVLGSPNSSNSLRLVEVGASVDCRAVLVSDLESIKSLDLEAINRLGLSSGASTPEAFFNNVVTSLRELGFEESEEVSAVNQG